MPWTGIKTTKAALRRALSAATKESRGPQRGRPVEIAGTGGWRAVGYWVDTQFGTFPGVDLKDPWDVHYQTGKANFALAVLETAMRGEHDYAPERAGGPRRWVIRGDSADNHPIGPFLTLESAQKHADRLNREYRTDRYVVDVARPTDLPYAQGGKRRHAPHKGPGSPRVAHKGPGRVRGASRAHKGAGGATTGGLARLVDDINRLTR